MERFLTTLLALSLAGALLTALLLALERLLGPRIPARVRYAAWLLVLLRLVLPVPGLVSLPAAAPAALPSAQVQAQSTETPRRYSPEAGVSFAVPGDPLAPSPQTSVPTETVPDGAPEAPATETAARPLDPWALGAALWAVGALGCFLWQLAGYLRWRRALFRSLRPARPAEQDVLCALNPRPWPALYRSAAAESPLLLGLLRPVIVLPERDYAPEMLDGILRHELTHHRRGDLAVKWLAAAIHALHWFNPLLPLLRRSLDRACELKCDALLLREMDREERQRYGELLLDLAAARPLSRRLVAVSFATEKRDLKERLVHIMKFKHTDRAVLALALAALLLLGGCAAAVGPASAETPAEVTTGAAPLSAAEPATAVEEPVPTAAPRNEPEPDPGPVVYADSVDAFLSGLGSHRTLVLRAGEYDLTAASDYGGPATVSYSWAEVGDGYELVLDRLEDLTILGEPGAAFVSLVTRPRYACVLRFEGCRDLTLDGITAGHTPEQGTCRGDVLCFNDCDNVSIDACDLYGCGSIGIEAVNCRRLVAEKTTVRECSYGALRVQNSYDFRFLDGEIRDCGQKTADGCFDLLQVLATTGFSVVNTEITGNRAQLFLADSWCAEVLLHGCLVRDNEFHEGMRNMGSVPVISGCGLAGNVPEERFWYVDQSHIERAVDGEGNPLEPADLETMEWNRGLTDPAGFTVVSEEGPEGVLAADGVTEYHVSTVDEFLACIGSDTRILLEGELFDLSTAKHYGGYGGAHYYWQATYDGPALVITGVKNLKIVGGGAEETRLETLPRYADVLSFYDCEDCAVGFLTAGHTRGAGHCAGDVISFRDCRNCIVTDCGLFGCGVNGVSAVNSTGLTVRDSEIYECSGHGAVLRDSEAVFDACTIRDCGWNTVYLEGESRAVWDGMADSDVFEKQ